MQISNVPSHWLLSKLEVLVRKLAWVFFLLLAACVSTPVVPPATNIVPPVIIPPAQIVSPFAVSQWKVLPEWNALDLSPSWPALLQSCRALKAKPRWQEICSHTEQVSATDNAALRLFYETWFTPYQVRNPDGSDHGMITGYYEPKLYGSRTKTARFAYPLYAVPDDMLTIDFGEAFPQLKDLRLRGRVQGKKVVPYYTRAEIDTKADSDTPANAIKVRELFWVDNAVELFFMQVQGSGRIELPDGKLIKVGYADQNGHSYVSIGKKLVEAGELKLEEASMQGIKNWAENNPNKLSKLLGQNPSYVFFRELPDGLSAPLGALGVPLTGEYSLAIDARTIPLGAPIFLSTTYPNDNTPLNRLMLAQDTGGAIRGAVRADFFWGFGEVAASQAGKMKQQGRLWVLFPKGGEP
jgi:membrane-bound lytic murein transglycosylase A